MNKKVIFLDNLSQQIFQRAIPIAEDKSLQSKMTSFWKHQHHVNFSAPPTTKFLHPDGSMCELTDFSSINSLLRGGETDERSNDPRSTKRSR